MSFVVYWLGPALALVGTLVSLATLGLYGRYLVSRIPGGEYWTVHWSERNRATMELRHAAGGAAAIAISLVPFLTFHWIGRFAVVPRWPLIVVLGTVHTIGAVVIINRVNAALRPPEATASLGARDRAAAAVYWTMLLLALAAVWWIGSAISSLRVAGFVVGAGVLLWSQWRTEAILRPLGLLVPPPEDVTAAALAVGIEPSRVFEMRATTPNALALPSGAVVVTSALIHILEPAELRAVLRHERAHLDESTSSWAVRLLPVAALIAFGPLVGFAIRGSADISTLLVFVVVVLSLLVTLGRLGERGRSLEADADHQAADEEPELYARSLERLYRVAGLPATHRGGTHPPLYDRMLAAGVEPEYARPAQPNNWSVAKGALVQFGVVLAILMTPPLMIHAVDEPLRTEIRIALGYDYGHGPATLAANAILDGDRALANEILEEAIDAGYDPSQLDLKLVDQLAEGGRCEEAWRRFDAIDSETWTDHWQDWSEAATSIDRYCGA